MCYNPTNGELYEPSTDLKSIFSLNCSAQSLSQEMLSVKKRHKLQLLDLFSGCGGLSYGFESFVSHIYAIEDDKAAAESFAANYKNASVMNSEANAVLGQLVHSKDHFVNQSLPDKHSIDIIIGGPPCQGFSGN